MPLVDAQVNGATTVPSRPAPPREDSGVVGGRAMYNRCCVARASCSRRFGDRSLLRGATPATASDTCTVRESPQQFMGELAAQVGISELSNCKIWYENENVLWHVSMPRFRFRTRFCSWKKLGNPNLSGWLSHKVTRGRGWAQV